MTKTHHKAYKPIILFLIPMVVFYVSGLFTLGFFWFSDTARAVAPTIFSGGFEAGDFSVWTSADSPKWNTTSGGPTDEHSGDARADVKGPTGEDDDILLKNVSTVGYENLTLSFWYKIKSALEEDDHVYVEWTVNDSDWHELTDFFDVEESDEWISASYDLSEQAVNNEDFGLRFRASLEHGNDEFYLDDVVLSGDVIPEGSKLSGHKFEDLNGNGARDENEPLLNGWTIWLNGDEYVVTGDDEKGWADGYYEFTNLDSDTYYICEEWRNEWTQTYPNSSTDNGNDYDIYEDCDGYEGELSHYGYEVEIDGDQVNNLNFGNFKYGFISGHKYAEETNDPIAEWGVYLMRPDGQRDNTNTDNNGEYRFENLGPGEYKICERLEDEDEEICTIHPDQTFPEGFYTIQMTSNAQGLNNPNYDFKNITSGRVKAFKFKDLDRDSSYDEGEPVLKGWGMSLYKAVGGGEEGLEFEFMERKETDATGWAIWEGQDLGLYRVVEDDRAGWVYTTTPSFEEELDERDHTAEFKFGNQPNEIKVVKFHDKNGNQERDEDEPLLAGWNFCLYRVIFPGDEGLPINELVPPCQATGSDGVAVWTELIGEEGEYLLDEEGQEFWFHTTGNDEEVFNFEGGMVTYYFGNNTTSVTIHKYYDINQNEQQDFWAENLLEPNLRGWKMCLYRILLSGEEDDLETESVLVSCQLTDHDGLATWIGLEPDLYRVTEEERENWSMVTGTEEPFELQHGNNVRIDFGNWAEDLNPPTSQFDQLRDHEVIDTEMVYLELTGRSFDQESGAKEATMSVYRLSGAESVQNYPAQSFFDVFTERRCPIELRPEEPLIPIEITSLSLVSVDPITVSWGHRWTPPSAGIYCFEVKATDYANRPEHTAWAGPLAYVPVTQVSDESKKDISTTSIIVEWVTDKPATSRVIYDTVSHLVLGAAPNYGYAFSTIGQDLDPKVTSHSVTVTGLAPGTIYYYRVVSAASPESVGVESSFATNSQNSSDGGGGGSAFFLFTISPTPTPLIVGGSTSIPSVSSRLSSGLGGQVISSSGISTPTFTPFISANLILAEALSTDGVIPTSNPNGQQNDPSSRILGFLANLGGVFNLDSLSWWMWLTLALVLFSVIFISVRRWTRR